MKTLVAIDGSTCSINALDFIAQRPWKTEDQFMVLSVVEPVPTEFGVGTVAPPSFAMEDRMFDECATISGNGGKRLQAALPQNVVEVKVEAGLVAETICASAEIWDADLIIMGSHGRKGLAHFLLGSVAEEVLKKAPCSVEVVKEKHNGSTTKPKSGAVSKRPQ